MSALSLCRKNFPVSAYPFGGYRIRRENEDIVALAARLIFF